jgi:hypothetical protein
MFSPLNFDGLYTLLEVGNCALIVREAHTHVASPAKRAHMLSHARRSTRMCEASAGVSSGFGLMSKDDEQYSDEEAERRAREALRRTLTTPPKPQKELVGKSSKRTTRRHSKERGSPEGGA